MNFKVKQDFATKKYVGYLMDGNMEMFRCERSNILELHNHLSNCYERICKHFTPTKDIEIEGWKAIWDKYVEERNRRSLI